jgi:hypothetical protein
LIYVSGSQPLCREFPGRVLQDTHFEITNIPLYLTYNAQCWCATEDFLGVLSVLQKMRVGVPQAKKVENLIFVLDCKLV